MPVAIKLKVSNSATLDDTKYKNVTWVIRVSCTYDILEEESGIASNGKSKNVAIER